MFIALSILIGLVAMVAYGTTNAFSKPLAKKYGVAGVIFLRGFTVLALLGIATMFEAPSGISWDSVLLALGLGAVGYIPLLAFTHGIKDSPLGVIAPIAGTAPLITVVLSSMFLGFELHGSQWIALGLVIAANVAVSVNVRNWRQSQLLQRASGVPFAFIAALGWGLFYFLLVPLSKSLGPIMAAFLVEVGVTTAAGLHLFTTKNRPKLLKSDILRAPVVVNGVLISIGTVAFTFGVSHYSVPIVAALSNSVAVITILLGVALFSETLQLKQRMASIVMIAGVVALPFL